MSVLADEASHRFDASPLLGAVPSVSRVSDTPNTVTVVDACTVVVPAVGELITTVQLPVARTVVQVLPAAGTNVAVAPPVFCSVVVTSVPAGAFANPVPSLTVTC